MSYAYSILGGLLAFMGFILKKLSVYFLLCRGYSLPISFTSWLVPFLYSLMNGGNIYHGLLALFGILSVHLATNLFDDIIDYLREKILIDRGRKSGFNFQKNKCICIINGDVTLKEAFIVALILFFAGIAIGIYFYLIYGIRLLYIVIAGGILCLSYPILGCLGFGEIIVAVIFAPLIYLGVNLVMSGNFSYDILILSVSSGLLSVGILHNHMLLDYKYDNENRKITLCRLCGNEKNALILLSVIIFLAYFNIIFNVLSGNISGYYLITLITVPLSIYLIKVMHIHIKNPEEEVGYNIFTGNKRKLEQLAVEQRSFFQKFFLAQNLQISFIILLCLAVISEKIL